MAALAAALPLAIVLGTMGFFGLSAAKAGAIGLAAALAVALVVFGPLPGGAAATLTGAGAEAL
ncbi:MAG: L-lactate permease, partial [Roseicyclus sp.]